MLNWYYSLEGWQWIAATVGCVSTVIVGFLGMVVAAGKTIFSIGNPTHKEKCPCEACQRKRRAAWERTYGIDKPPTVDKSSPLISTRQLKAGMVVLSKSSLQSYQVKDIQILDGGNRLIYLRNSVTSKSSMGIIRRAILDAKIWHGVS